LTSWRCIIIFVMVAFWTPLKEVVKTIPNVLNSSDSVSVGGVSLHVKRRIANTVSADVRQVLRELDAEDVREILSHGSRHGISLIAVAPPNHAVLERCRRWEKLGLIVTLNDQEVAKVRELNQDAPPPNWSAGTYAWQPTQL